jgi:cellulose biosynthesis protein BcsQ
MKLITFFATKGNIGKSTFSFSLCKDLNFKYATNDPINSKLNKELLEYIPLSKIKDNNTILDLGGYLDKTLLSYLKASDLIIFPTECTKMAYLSFKEIYPELVKINPNFIIVINKIEGGINTNNDLLVKYYNSLIKLGLKKEQIFMIRKSTVLEKTFDENVSLSKLYNDNNFKKHTIKGIKEDYTKLLWYVKNIK